MKHHVRRTHWFKNQPGLALVSVLWVLALLALIAGNFTRTTRTEVILARYLIEQAEAQALADAGVERAILGLLDVTSDKAWRVDGTVYGWRYGDAEIRIAVQDEGGKLDVNWAPDRLLAALFRSAGLSEDEALEMMDRIADFRDADDLHREKGAEDAHYAEAGLPWGAKDAPFETIDELQQVLGMTFELYERIKPALTVFAGNRSPYEPTAPREVRAFYGFSDLKDNPQEDSADREQRIPQQSEGPVVLKGDDTPLPRSDVPVYTIHAEAMLPSGTQFARSAIVRITGDLTQPVYILSWNHVSRTLFGPNGSLENGEY